jgi:hypothetical protein
MPDRTYAAFLAAYPARPGIARKLNGDALGNDVERHFGMVVPEALRSFWTQVGAGVFGRGMLYVFGDASSGLPGPELLDWNAREWWRHVYPPPAEGGPFFFGQTHFGDQLGFRWDHGDALPVLFAPDTVESFRLAENLDELFGEVLTTPAVLDDPDRLALVQRTHGEVPPGKHFVPDLSPLLGGMGESFHVESAAVHLMTAIAEWEAIRKLPPGTKVSKIHTHWH